LLLKWFSLPGALSLILIFIFTFVGNFAMPPPSAHFDTDLDHDENAVLTSDSVAVNRQNDKLSAGTGNESTACELNNATNEIQDDGAVQIHELETTNTNVIDPNEDSDTLEDGHISIVIPELELRESQALLLLSWILLVYRNTEKNRDSQYAFNDTTATIKDTLSEDAEQMSKSILRVRQLLDGSGLSTTSNDLTLSTISEDADYTSQVRWPF
jgi:hypothetical protein